MLQYITNTSSPVPIVEQIKRVVKGGCKWIQIRMKDASDEEISRVVDEIKPLCIENEVFLILDDRVELAKSTDVGGVHLGKNDMLPSKARLLLGPAAVIGVTANTIDDIMAVHTLDIDYLGVGPFRYTTTKENLSPTLGIEGIKEISSKMRALNIELPFVAVGGITKDDLIPLLKAGCNGVAVSGAIAFAEDITQETESFIKILKSYK